MQDTRIHERTLLALTIINVLRFGLCMWVASVKAQSVNLHWASPLRDRFVTFYAEPVGKAPLDMSVWVQSDAGMVELRQRQQAWEAEARTNSNLILTKPFSFKTSEETPDFGKAAWVPFKTNLFVDLGPRDGGRWLWVAFRKGAGEQVQWAGHFIVVQSSPLWVSLTNPLEHVDSRPMIELQGFCPVPLQKIQYDEFDQNGKPTAHGQGFVNDQYYDSLRSFFTTNYFSCYDIDLKPGTNTIVLHCADYAGNTLTTNLTYVFTTAGDTSPPVISLDWPRPQEKLTGQSFTARGRLDDFTAQITGQISARGETNNVTGLMERDGSFWIERLPLALGENHLTLTATDAAGNVSSINLVLYGVEGELTMDPVSPPDQLWQPYLNVTGKVNPPKQRVWINGVEAEVKPNGTWFAKHVPVRSSPSGGTAIFDLTSHPPEEMTSTIAAPAELLSAQANLGTNVMTLNASEPACGVFQIHVNNTEQVGFVLLVSTNLVDWEPLLTNSDPKVTFDFTDTNANNYPCRFFRIVPFP